LTKSAMGPPVTRVVGLGIVDAMGVAAKLDMGFEFHEKF
jgi:hypothetical protein